MLGVRLSINNLRSLPVLVCLLTHATEARDSLPERCHEPRADVHSLFRVAKQTHDIPDSSKMWRPRVHGVQLKAFKCMRLPETEVGTFILARCDLVLRQGVCSCRVGPKSCRVFAWPCLATALPHGCVKRPKSPSQSRRNRGVYFARLTIVTKHSKVAAVTTCRSTDPAPATLPNKVNVTNPDTNILWETRPQTLNPIWRRASGPR